MLNVASSLRRPASPTRHDGDDPKGTAKVRPLVVDGLARGGYLRELRAGAEAERWGADALMEDGPYTRVVKIDSIDPLNRSPCATDESHLKGKRTAKAGEGDEWRWA